MMSLFEFKYPNGRMAINVDEFFPTSKTKLIKLLKVIGLNYGSDRDEICARLLNTLKEDFHDRGFNDPDLLKNIANKAVDAGTHASEIKEEVEKLEKKVKDLTVFGDKQKRKETKALLKSAKERLGEQLSNKRYYSSLFKKTKTTMDQYKGNIETVEELLNKWRTNLF